MPAWAEIVAELNRPENRQPNGLPDFDKVRRRYLAALAHKTGRATIVYSAGFLDKDAPANVAITLGDMQGFMNAVAGLDQRELDLLITSPGGSAEATESIVAYLRTQFDHIRAIVPVAAMSAATMLALGSDEIVMGAHSQLGPIDPQFVINTPDGPRSAPGQAILDQFKEAKRECRNPQNLAAWMPILRAYLPGLLAMCRDQRKVAQRMVRQWLGQYMLRDDPEASNKAGNAAKWFGNYAHFRSHGRRVSLQDVRQLGLRVAALEDDHDLQDAVLSVHHCYSVTHANTPAVKIIENHLGRAYVKMEREVLIPVSAPQPRAPRGAGQPAQPTGTPSSRAARRRAQRGQR
jgi:hypothetical protein